MSGFGAAPCAHCWLAQGQLCSPGRPFWSQHPHPVPRPGLPPLDCHMGRLLRSSSRNWKPPLLIHLGLQPGPVLPLNQIELRRGGWRRAGLSSLRMEPRKGQPLARGPQQGRERKQSGRSRLCSNHATLTAGPAWAWPGLLTVRPGRAALINPQCHLLGRGLAMAPEPEATTCSNPSPAFAPVGPILSPTPRVGSLSFSLTNWEAGQGVGEGQRTCLLWRG